jgi:predicted lipoprotein with Yx(FWY)xxD motif
MSVSKSPVRVLGVGAVLLLAAACGSTTSTSSTTPAAGSTGAAASGGVVKVAKTSLGSVLVDSNGLTVYTLSSDTPGHSTCSAACLKFWPAVVAPGASVPAVSGVSAPLGVTKTMAGGSMVTAGGLPVYTFALDKAAGDVNGEGKVAFGGTWYAVSPAGAAVKSAGSAPTTSGAGTGSGY